MAGADVIPPMLHRLFHPGNFHHSQLEGPDVQFFSSFDVFLRLQNLFWGRIVKQENGNMWLAVVLK